MPLPSEASASLVASASLEPYADQLSAGAACAALSQPLSPTRIAVGFFGRLRDLEQTLPWFESGLFGMLKLRSPHTSVSVFAHHWDDAPPASLRALEQLNSFATSN